MANEMTMGAIAFSPAIGEYMVLHTVPQLQARIDVLERYLARARAWYDEEYPSDADDRVYPWDHS